ncbi:peptidoglycan editing factor PgeF [Lysobacter brunescens]|uniref:Purine nucleoside phosphorylase n=1 Tax=Lysobacter brunescens TaxID=262323 RepID=A0ABW2YB41_9GAMM
MSEALRPGPFLHADWPAPPGIHAFTTLRHGAGASQAPFHTFNLGNRYAAEGDAPAVVERNRAELVRIAGLPAEPHWLRQVHGIDVVRVDGPGQGAEPAADASVTSTPGTVLAILTADCLPVVFAADDGSEVAAAHAGWPGLSAGMLEATVAAMRTPPDRLVAWIGPAAGPERYEIGAEVRDRFLAWDACVDTAFVPTRPGHWRVDLFAIARMRLARAGVARVYGGDVCTLSDPQRFFSHRRDARTGRMVTLVWIDPSPAS